MDSDLLTPTLAALLGIVAPFVISLVKNWKMSQGVVQVIVVGVSLLFGFLALLVGGMFADGVTWTTEAVVGYAAVVAVVAQFVYNSYFRGTNLNARLERFAAPDPLGGIAPPGGSRPASGP